MRNKTRLRRYGWLSGSLLLLLLVLVAAGCGGGGSGSSDSTAAEPEGGKSEPVTLKFMSLANSESVEAAWAELIEAFEAKHPDISIERTPVAYGSGGSSYRTKAKLAASGSDAPDLIEGDMGPGGVMASLVSAQLLDPLDEFVGKYGWEEKYGKFIAQLQLSANGKEVGNGPVYGIPGFAEILGVFYNKQLLAKTGMKEPKTLAEFEATLKAAKEAGITPIMLGGLDQFPWSHIYDVISDRYGDPQELIDWFRGNEGSSVETPQMEAAAETLQKWVSEGYFEDGANGVSDADAGKRFAGGEALYRISGPWAAEEALNGLGKNAGFFLMPPVNAGDQPTSTGWMGWSVGITSASDAPDQGAEFLDFLTGDEAREIMLKHYNPPGTPGTTYGAGTPPLVRTIGESFSQLIEAETLVPYMDVAYPQVDPFNLLANAQSMAAGEMSPSDFLQTTQHGWLEYHGY